MENYYVDNIDTLNKNFNNINSRFTIRILQINIRGMNSQDKFDTIKEFLSLYTGTIDLVVIEETWVKVDRIQLFRIDGYKAIFSCRDDSSGGGLAVFVRNQIIFDELINSHELGFHHIHVRLKLGVSPFDVHAVYRPPSFNSTVFFDKLESICSSHNKESLCVIVGDINIPVNQSGCRIACEYLDLLRSYNFSVTNTIPTRPASNNVLDHVVCSELLQGSVTNETMPTDVSDHCFILSTFHLRKPVDLVQLEKTIVHHTKLNEAFITAMQNIPEGSAEDKLKYTLDMFRALKLKFSKTVSIQAKVKGQCPWMTFDLWKLMRMKDNILKNHRRRPDNRQLQELLAHISKKVQRVKACAKKAYYSRLLETTDQKFIWRNINQIMGRQADKNGNVKLEIGGHLTSHGPTVAENFNEFFSLIGPQLASTIKSNRDICKFDTLTPTNQSIFLRPTTVQEVITRINDLDINKCPGPDGIPAYFVKTHHQIFAPLLKDVFNESIAFGSFPDCLKIARVVPVHKSGSKIELNNYRPISVLSVLSKLIEQILADRISNYLDNQRIVYDHQFGFRRGSSTWTAASELVDDIYHAMDSKKMTGVLFLDLKKAFDTVDHSILLQKLEYYGIRGVANNLLRSYLTGRRQYVYVNGATSSERMVTVGVPQGSNLGPLLFLLYINDLSKLQLYGKPRMFADDTSVTYVADNTEQLMDQMREDLSKLQMYFSENLLSLNLTKTKYMIFHSPRTRVVVQNELLIDSTVIEKVEEFKYLGLIFDSTLKWSTHIGKLKREISSFCGIFWRISKFFPLKHLVSMYQAFVQSKLQYLVSIWGSATKTLLKPLQAAQNRCLKVVYNRPRLYSTVDLYKNAAPSVFPILALREIQTLVNMKNILYNRSTHHNFVFSRSVHTHNTRNQGNLIITRRNTEIGKKSFTYYGKSRYNALSTTLKDEPNIFKFKLHIKQMIRNNLCEFLV